MVVTASAAAFHFILNVFGSVLLFSVFNMLHSRIGTPRLQCGRCWRKSKALGICVEKCAKAAFSAGTAKRWYLAAVTGSSGSVIGQREWFCLVCQMKGVAAFTVAIVSSHGQLAEGWFAPLDVFFFFSLSTQRWGLAVLKETEKNWSACNCGCLSWQWESGKVGPSLQTGSSLHQQSLLFRPPPFCHLSDNKLILCYGWKELTFFHNLPSHNFSVLQYFKNRACMHSFLFLKTARIWEQIKMLAAALHCNLPVFALWLLQCTIVHRLPGSKWKRCYSSQLIAFSDGYKNRCG